MVGAKSWACEGFAVFPAVKQGYAQRMLNVRIVALFGFWGLLYGFFLNDPIGGLSLPLGAAFYVYVWVHESFAWSYLDHPFWHPLPWVGVILLYGLPVAIWVGLATLHEMTGLPAGNAYWIFPVAIFVCGSLLEAFAPFIGPAPHSIDGSSGRRSPLRPSARQPHSRR